MGYSAYSHDENQGDYEFSQGAFKKQWKQAKLEKDRELVFPYNMQ